MAVLFKVVTPSARLVLLLSVLLIDVHAFVSQYSSFGFHQVKTERFKNKKARSTLSPVAASARPAIDWIKSQPLESLLPKTEALAIISELLSNDALIDDSEELVSKNWDSLNKRLRDETRSSSEILGQETTDRILKSAESVEGYDPEAVRAFLESDAVNALFAKVLFDGIFEFFQKIDVFGQIIGNLPIIGPIRNQIVTETKRNLDRTLGPLVQNFLKSYTKIAVLQASDFVLSPANQKAFRGANVKLVTSLLERPINSLLPPSDMSDKLKTEAFEYLRKVDMKDVEEYLDLVYDFAGDKSIDRAVNVDRVLDASPTLQATVDRLWTNAITAQESSSLEEPIEMGDI